MNNLSLPSAASLMDEYVERHLGGETYTREANTKGISFFFSLEFH